MIRTSNYRPCRPIAISGAPYNGPVSPYRAHDMTYLKSLALLKNIFCLFSQTLTSLVLIVVICDRMIHCWKPYSWVYIGITFLNSRQLPQVSMRACTSRNNYLPWYLTHWSKHDVLAIRGASVSYAYGIIQCMTDVGLKDECSKQYFQNIIVWLELGGLDFFLFEQRIKYAILSCNHWVFTCGNPSINRWPLFVSTRWRIHIPWTIVLCICLRHESFKTLFIVLCIPLYVTIVTSGGIYCYRVQRAASLRVVVYD